ncbi:hypothetical protein, partial [Mesorhizobium sp. M1A.T.Ca.IN.004.03.1.1]|uniref:hypothetical protein n=1 Tax=Mesorhizobium sp. M1A.T.Ca.IN.004.03.1.1 TaxID=2496795 RepID=UPI0019CF6DB1
QLLTARIALVASDFFGNLEAGETTNSERAGAAPLAPALAFNARMAPALTETLDDWITASTLPGSDGLYFLGAFERRITFYSQQVRA